MLGIFAKLPEAGQTKTRLAASIGDQSATELYAAFVEDLLARCGQRSETLVVAITPDNAATKAWFDDRIAENTVLLFQPNGRLGQRIQWFFDTAFEQGATQVVLIGSDSPDLPTTIIDDAFLQLATSDMVVTPAADGGFVLIGLSTPLPAFFGGIPWSSLATLAATVQSAERRGISIRMLAPWYDIDTVENLGTLLAMQRNSPLAASCPQTKQRLETLWLKLAGPDPPQD